jgi:hypothetical protein
MPLKRFILIIPLAFLLSLFFLRCAIVVSPTGGPKDTIPPILVRSTPPIYSTNFNRQRVTLTFNEFIELKEISQKLILSPPQERLPDFRVRGKSIELSFFEPLLDSTTYTLYFSDAIVDLNEGNPLVNFEFAFSTGNEIDSLQFIGKVIDAFTLEPQVGILVMLYDQIKDSIPLLERPIYVTKTNKEGNFFLSNLRQDDFKIFALKDGNSNYLFDQVTEPVAFSQDTIFSTLLSPPLGDSLKKLKDKSLTLRLFQEENRAQSLTDFSRVSRRGLKVGFSRKPEGALSLVPINFPIDSSESWFQLERGLAGDTLTYWITNNEISNIDSLFIRINYYRTDSILNLNEVSDTLRFFYSEKQQPSRSRRREAEEPEKPVSLPVSFSASKGKAVLPHEPLRLTFNMPLLSLNNNMILLEDITDSVAINTEPKIDSLNPRFYSIEHLWQHNTKYRFTALPGAFTDLNGLTNDTLVVDFNGANPDYFGTINLNLTGVEPNVIVELLTEKRAVVDRKIVEKDDKVSFNYVKPGKYIIRFTLDANKNGKWDTGWYLKGIQPEKIVMYQEKGNVTVHNIRANWEYDISFNLDQHK